MKRNITHTAAGALAALLLCGAGAAWAQPTPAQIQQQEFQRQQNELGMYYQQQQNNRRTAPHGPSAAEVRAWERREAEVQARIARFRATPYWMAVAYEIPNRRIMYAGGYRTEAEAVEKTMRQCERGHTCHRVATFANTCAMIAYPDNGPKTPSDIFVGKHPDSQQAIVRAVRACEAVHGYDQCSYADVQTKTGNAFCSGYEYGIYQK
ncbi:DUF4189 domain-containing protein [Eikenella sp. S3360]|uniref:DUF4189 domain-containing protein n=1 Tax=Eikenella glucosivorans TaxID=2766967 RepID=A0ABS0NBJ6_9NEIS|nr:DUF4189 domain-containing protein [Eikenella glucosivorans]MBH5329666.1 DUF4189 domain-containing protein [Eikenella glucosivorans]